MVNILLVDAIIKYKMDRVTVLCGVVCTHACMCVSVLFNNTTSVKQASKCFKWDLYLVNFRKTFNYTLQQATDHIQHTTSLKVLT